MPKGAHSWQADVVATVVADRSANAAIVTGRTRGVLTVGTVDIPVGQASCELRHRDRDERRAVVISR
jgi:hypothetical protein